MSCKSLTAIAALALLASMMPPSMTTAGELKGRQKQQKLLVPAVQKVRESAARSTRSKPGALKGSGSGNQSKSIAPQGSVKFFVDGISPR